MWTRKELRDTLKQAHWAALNCDELEYRVVEKENGELDYEEWVAGDNCWNPNEIILETYTTAPSIYEWIPEGEADEDALEWLQEEFEHERLDNDVEEVVGWYEKEYGVKVK